MIEQDHYSKAFETFVEHEADIVGLLAYSLYKQRKRDWVVKHKEDHENRPPLAERHIDYERSMLIERVVTDLREKAESLLVAYASQYTQLQAPQIREDALSAEILNAKSAIIQSQSLWRQIVQGLGTSIITTAILVLLVIAAGLFGIDVLDGIRAVSEAVAT